MKSLPVLLASLFFATACVGPSDAERHHSTEMNRGAHAATSERAVKDGLRVLFVGNSITLHSPCPSIGWTNNWGMAASALEKDYVHLVTAGIERETGRRADLRIRNLAEFERGFETYDFAKIADLVAFRPDYLVVALGENVRPLATEKDKLAYREAFRKLLERFVQGGARPRVVVKGTFWRNDERDALMAHAARELGMTFVATPCTDDSMMALGLFKHGGVAAHPGDKGMAEMARLVLKAFFGADRGTRPHGP